MAPPLCSDSQGIRKHKPRPRGMTRWGERRLGKHRENLQLQRENLSVWLKNFHPGPNNFLPRTEPSSGTGAGSSPSGAHPLAVLPPPLSATYPIEHTSLIICSMGDLSPPRIRARPRHRRWTSSGCRCVTISLPTRTGWGAMQAALSFMIDGRQRATTNIGGLCTVGGSWSGRRPCTTSLTCRGIRT